MSGSVLVNRPRVDGMEPARVGPERPVSINIVRPRPGAGAGEPEQELP